MNFMERVQAPPWKGAIKFIQKLFICVVSREIEEIFIYQVYIIIQIFFKFIERRKKIVQKKYTIKNSINNFNYSNNNFNWTWNIS